VSSFLTEGASRVNPNFLIVNPRRRGKPSRCPLLYRGAERIQSIFPLAMGLVAGRVRDAHVMYLSSEKERDISSTCQHPWRPGLSRWTGKWPWRLDARDGKYVYKSRATRSRTKDRVR
jgi:hypothetical protein